MAAGAAAAAVRVRFAPSPTGFMHLGGLRTALFNGLFAKAHGGKLILRIEDTDQARLVPGAADSLEEILHWAGLPPDESPTVGGGHGPYIQSQRLDLYHDHTDQLLERGRAYRCFCTSERLEKLRKLAARTNRLTAYDGTCRHMAPDEITKKLQKGVPHTVRLKTPNEGTISVTDLVYGRISFNYDALDDQVLMKSNGYPTYHLANVVDDHLMQITHVIRGEEWLSSTAKHVMLYDAFEWEAPAFAHIPLLVNFDRSKLSKRHDHARVEALRHEGYLPSALMNFVTFLGWSSPEQQTEVYKSVDEIARDFSLDAVSKSPATVDTRKLKHLNKQHQLDMAPGDAGLANTVDMLLPAICEMYSDAEQPGVTANAVHDSLLSAAYLEEVVLACRGTFHTLREVTDCNFFWELPCWATEETRAIRAKMDPVFADQVMAAIIVELEALKPAEFTASNTQEAVVRAAGGLGLKPGKLQPTLRFAITARKSGPSLYNILEVLGKDRTTARIKDMRISLALF